MKNEFDCIEINPALTARYSVIWLHGLGADGHDFEGIVPELNLPEAASIRFVFPNAPVQPVTINNGFQMRAWYDILDSSLARKVDVRGIYQSSDLVTQIIHREIDKGIPPEHILLAGFSQGGVVALHCGLRFPAQLAGILALSTYLPTLNELNTERSPANRSTAILMAHGLYDSMIPIQLAQNAYQGLKLLQYPVAWAEYAMEHSVCAEEVKRIADFIRDCFQLKR